MRCPKGHSGIPDGSQYCNECGIKLSSVNEFLIDPNIIPPPPEGERRFLTVLFADIMGYTSLCESISSDDLSWIMNIIMHRLSYQVISRGGHIDKIIGDCVMALFGAPEAHEDDPVRAIEAALGMQVAMVKFNQDIDERNIKVKLPKKLRLRVGISTGEVIWGHVAHEKITVLSDTVNVASRLESNAPPGEILVDRETQKLAYSKFVFARLDPISVKNRKKHVQPYLVKSKLEIDPSLLGLSELKVGMIGRDKEMSKLERYFHQAMSDKIPQFVLITGEPGIGKSRLLEEFENYLVDLSKTILLLKGRYPDYGSGHFWPLREMIRVHFNLVSNSTESKDKIGSETLPDDDSPSSEQAFLKTISNELAILARSEHDVLHREKMAHLIGKHICELNLDDTGIDSLDAKQRHEELLLALTSWFIAVAAKQPTVVVIDDMHRSDDSTQELIEQFITNTQQGFGPKLLKRSADSGLIFIMLARDEIEENWKLTKEWPCLRIDLKSLNRDDIEDLAQQSLKGKLSAETVDFMTEHTGGNPLFTEEYIKFLFETESLVAKQIDAESNVVDELNNEWGVKQNLDFKQNFPTSLAGLLGARIDALPDEPQKVLKNASVVGRIFWEMMVAKMLEKNLIKHELTLLNRKQMILEHPQSKIINDNEYVFKHGLLREAAYYRLINYERRRLHRCVAKIIEAKIARESRSSLLSLKAFHLEKAKLFDEAISTFQLAAKQACEEGSPLDAAFYVTNAINLLEQLSASSERDILKAELLEQRADILILPGRFDEAFADLNEAEELFQDPEKKVVMSIKIGKILEIQGQTNEAMELFQKAYEVTADPCERAQILLDITRIEYGIFNDYEKVMILCDKIVKTMKNVFPSLERPSDLILNPIVEAKEIEAGGEILAKLRHYYGALAQLRGNLDEAKKYYVRNLTYFEKINKRIGIVYSASDMGGVLMHEGEYDRALGYFQKSLKISEQIGFSALVARTYYSIGRVYYRKGDPDQAIKLFEKYLAISEESGDKLELGKAFNAIGLVQRSQGYPDLAIEYFQKYLMISEEITNKGGIATASCNLGLAYRDKGNFDKALELFERDLKLNKEIGNELATATASANMGLMHHYKGDREQALKLLENCHSICMQYGDKENEAAALLGLVQVKRENEKFDEAIEYTNEAIEVYKSIDLKHMEADCWLENVQSYLENNNLLAAVEAWQKAETIFNELGEQFYSNEYFLVKMSLLAHQYIENNTLQKFQELEEAINIVQQMADRFHNTSDIQSQIKVQYALGNAHKALKRESKSTKALKNALDLATKYGFVPWERLIKKKLNR